MAALIHATINRFFGSMFKCDVPPNKSAIYRAVPDVLTKVINWLPIDDASRLLLTGDAVFTHAVRLAIPRTTSLRAHSSSSNKSQLAVMRVLRERLRQCDYVTQLSVTSSCAMGYNVHDLLQLCQPKASLTHLKLHFNFDLTHATLEMLPRGLIHLDLIGLMSNPSNDSLRALPPNLTFLQLGDIRFAQQFGVHAQYDDQGVSQLPQTLTHLRLDCAYRLKDALACVPRSLVHLTLNHARTLRSEHAKALPACLLHLDVRYAHFKSEYFADLPRALTYLNIGSTRAINRNLPPDLSFLDVGEAMLTDGDIAHLPRKLTHLSATRAHDLTDGSAINLPRTLTHLDIASSYLMSDACVCDLPSSLVELVLPFRSCVSKHGDTTLFLHPVLHSPAKRSVKGGQRTDPDKRLV